MLIGTLPRTSEKRLALLIPNEPLRQVLAGLLREWRYSLKENPAAADLLIAEDGFPVPEGSASVLWLTRSQHEGKDRLTIPLSLEKLWAELERRIHETPRSRIRIKLELPAILEVRNETDEIRITSLSDLGGRFELNRELANGEELLIGMDVAGRRLNLSGRVIYVVPRGDLKGSGRTQVGVIFDYRDKSLRKVLHDFITRSFLERVREGMAGDHFREGLTHFDVSADLLGEIGFLPGTEVRPET